MDENWRTVSFLVHICFWILRGISCGCHWWMHVDCHWHIKRVCIDQTSNVSTVWRFLASKKKFSKESHFSIFTSLPWPWIVPFGENWSVRQEICSWKQRWPADKVSGMSSFVVSATICIEATEFVDNFRWKPASPECVDKFDGNESYIGVMGNCVWHLRQDNDHLFYRILGELNEKTTNELVKVRYKVTVPRNVDRRKKSNGLLFDDKYYEDLLMAYFRMETNLTECYRMWSVAHNHFAQEADRFYAIRVLNQDPVENLFSFICSQNNHIAR